MGAFVYTCAYVESVHSNTASGILDPWGVQRTRNAHVGRVSVCVHAYACVGKRSERVVWGACTAIPHPSCWIPSVYGRGRASVYVHTCIESASRALCRRTKDAGAYHR